jgi:hypothetical protein
MAVSRADLLSHLKKARFSEGDVRAAHADALRIATCLKEHYGAEVYGIGSLFETIRPFRKGSDIDLVARGIPKAEYFDALAEVQAMTDFGVDLIPWEAANDLVREIVRVAGVKL